MNRAWKMGVAGIVGAVVAVPAAIVIAGAGGGAFVTGDVDRQTIEVAGQKGTASSEWKPVPGFSGVVVSPATISVNLSAQMTQGKAKFRIVRINSSATLKPGPVLFSSKAANSFTWGAADTCGQGEQHVLQWKRVGKGKAVASKLSKHTVWDTLCL